MLFLLKIDKFANEDMVCFCIRDERGKGTWIEGAGNSAFERKFKGEILQTGSFDVCAAFCAGFAKAIYRDVQEIVAVSKEAQSLRKEMMGNVPSINQINQRL